ncbi:Protein phosphatase 2C-like protein [Zancudomyces culisetae]|uniref:Protein phosphatase 2C-like protein n=1 Tax=Zancudomyces culisetae TaxID=1213189 RepID=A0A1R1PYK2_ZANCU|nr:Protein phosphatase 2C-like protein [Zancudomyces culisetae]|eukprot:OMH85989.1 Protein phosphatase 2C-like protein [Zancudomyces culisetae]
MIGDDTIQPRFRGIHTENAKRQETSEKKPEEKKNEVPKKKYSTTTKVTMALVVLAGVGFVYRFMGASDKRKEIFEQDKTTIGIPEIIKNTELKRTRSRDKLDKIMDRREKMRAAWMTEPLEEKEVDAILQENQNAASCFSHGDGEDNWLKIQFYSNQISSNESIEDYLAWSSLKASPGKQNKARHFFGVFDGHAGYMCAERISQELTKVVDESLEMIEDKKKSSTKSQEKLNKLIGDLVRATPDKSNITTNALALVGSFVRMDQMIVEDALEEYLLSENQQADVDRLLGPAVSGSCGLGCIVDGGAETVTVANTGDSRAIIGTRGENGKWKAVILSVDQTAGNLKELERMKKEHAGEEDTVIQRGRVLGGLMPTRAFGDSRYKWPLDIQEKLFPMLYNRGHRYATTPRNYLTPPYVTAQPVLVEHRLNKGSDKFVVLATDGLWDRMSNEDVVETVGEWWDAHYSTNQAGKEPAINLETGEKLERALPKVDENPATHLIRTALSTDDNGHVQKQLINKLLAIPPPYSRRFRDDISAYVVLLDH